MKGANYRLQKVRPCGPKIHAIREATCDVLFESFAADVTVAVTGNPDSTVEVSVFLMHYKCTGLHFINRANVSLRTAVPLNCRRSNYVVEKMQFSEWVPDRMQNIAWLLIERFYAMTDPLPHWACLKIRSKIICKMRQPEMYTIIIVFPHGTHALFTAASG